MMIKSLTKLGLLLFVTSLLLAGCVTKPPRHLNNVCLIFRQYPKWYWATQDTRNKWGVPIAVQMAFMHQESRFNGVAKPPRTHILWIIPWFRPSSSYGYTQALDQTWRNYQRSTGSRGKRSDFQAASDFIGWYANQTHRRTGVALNNAYALYLAYHEGAGGYLRRTYVRKAWLIAVAHKVSARAQRYQRQLNACRSSLPQRHWWQFWLYF